MKHRDPFILCPHCMPRLVGSWAAMCALVVLVWWLLA